MAYQTGIFFSEGGNSLTFTPSATVVDERLQPAGSRSVDVAADETEIPVTHPVVLKETGADAEACTLADGAFDGQLLVVSLGTDGGGDATITPDTSTGWATVVLADAGDTATLLFIDSTTGWVIVGTAGVAGSPVISV